MITIWRSLTSIAPGIPDVPLWFGSCPKVQVAAVSWSAVTIVVLSSRVVTVKCIKSPATLPQFT